MINVVTDAVAAKNSQSVQQKRWTTPRVLHALLVWLWLSAGLLLLVSTAGVGQHYQAIKTVGLDSAPSIIAAQSIKAALADLDANVANELMVPPGHDASSIEGYTQRRKEIGDSLIGAAENITYGNVERKPILTLETALGDYEVAATRARILHERGDDNAALMAYHQACQILEETLFPAADALSHANSEALDHTYAQGNAVSVGTTVLLWLAGALLIAVLIATQVFLSRRMRRTLNPALLAATVFALMFLFYTTHAFLAATDRLKVAKEDAFTSILALWQARAVAYDANTDESRWLLDRARTGQYQAAFYTKTAQLLELPGGQSYESVAAATQGMLPKDARGYFATELGNITFVGEQDAALDMVHTYGVYYADDRKLRDMENAGQHAAAVAYCISMAPGDSNWAFDQFDKALGKTLDINRHAFDSAVKQGLQALNNLKLLCLAVAAIIAILAFIGLRPRIQEYQ